MRYVRQEQRRNETLVNYGHIGIGLALGLLALITGGETSRPALIGMMIASPFLITLGAMALLMLRSPNRLEWLPYLSVISEVALVTGILVAVGTHASFKGAAFLGYFVVIGLAGLRFSPNLIMTGGLLSIASYAGTFMWCVRTGECVIAPMSEALMGPYVSVALVIQQISFLAMVAGLLTTIATRSRRGLSDAISEEFGEERTRRSNDRVREGIARVIATEIAGRTEVDPAASEGTAADVALLVCEAQNIETLAASLSYEELVGVLSRLFSDVTEAVVAFGGTPHCTTDRGVVAVFGAPRSRDADEEMAIRAADRVCERIATMNSERAASSDPALVIGLGIHSGSALVRSHSEVWIRDGAIDVASAAAAASVEANGAIIVTEDAFARVRGTVRSIGRTTLTAPAREITAHEIDRVALR